MLSLKPILEIPAVKSAVLCDLDGALLEAVREPDGEGVAAVAGFLTSAMVQAGDHLGLGELNGISFNGHARACLMVVKGDSIATAFVEPPASVAAVETAFDRSPHRG